MVTVAAFVGRMVIPVIRIKAAAMGTIIEEGSCFERGALLHGKIVFTMGRFEREVAEA